MTALFSSLRRLLRSREEVFQDIYESRQFDAVYFAMLVFGCLIALLGLLMNSPAVIIGAMLISPLMGPILSCGLALTTADWALGKKAARNIAFSIVEVVAIAAVATWLSPLKNVTPEILARTNPNLMDLLVAFFSGLAGTLALSSRKGGLTIIPGVAVATAVMPPLATIGYGLSTGQYGLARGASMLFLTNLTAIVISADLVFFLAGFRPSRRELPEKPRLLVRYRTAIAFLVLLALSVPLLKTLVHAARQVQLRRSLGAALRQELKKSGRRLDRMNLHVGAKTVVVDAAVQTVHFIDTAEIRRWEEVLAGSAGRPVRLDLQQLQLARKEAEAVQAAENRDYLAGGSIRPAAAQQELSTVGELEKLQEKVEDSLRTLLTPAGIEELRVLSLGKQPDGSLLLQFTAVAPRPLDDAVWSVAAAAIGGEVASAVTLKGSVVVLNASDVITYRANAIAPDRKALRRVQRLLARWKDRPRLRYRLLVSGALDNGTTQKRLVLLRARLRSGPPEDTDLAVVTDQTEPHRIVIQLVQSVDSTSTIAPPADAKPRQEKASSAVAGTGR